jgi:hypothetical protein
MMKLAIGALVLSTAGVSLGFVTVADTGADFNSLATAVSVVTPGEEIRVSSAYVEDQPVTTTKNLLIRSYNPAFSAPQPGARLEAPFAVDASAGLVSVTAEGMHFSDQTTVAGPSISLWGGAANLTLQNDCLTSGIGHGLVIQRSAVGSTVNVTDSTLAGGRNALSIGANSNVTIDGSTIGPSGYDAILVQESAAVNQVALSLNDTVVSGSATNGIDIFGYTALTLTNTTIAHNGRNGVLLNTSMASGTLTMNNCDIRNNGYMGFSTLALLNPVSIQDSNFVDNGHFGFATNWDTAVRHTAGAGGMNMGTVRNCKFSGNNHSGVYFGRHVYVTFEDCQVNNNFFHGITSQDPRGADSDFSNIAINNCVIDFNGRGLRANIGHNMEILVPLDLTITSASLSNSLAGIGLHMLNGPGSIVKMTDVKLNNNKTHGFYPQTKVIDTSILRCQFNDNGSAGLVTQTAGANFSNLGTITDSQFNNNKAHGLHINNGIDLALLNCSVTGNTTFGIVRTGDIGGQAGAEARFTVTGCDITGNGYGVGMYSTLQSWTVTDCQISNGAGGTAILFSNASARTIDASFNRCYVYSTSPTAGRLISANGAAINSFPPVSFTNCVFEGGQAGFVASTQSRLTFDYSTFATRGQVAGTGFVVSNGAGPTYGDQTVNVNRSIITGYDTAIDVQPNGLMEVTNSLVNGTVTGMTLGAGTVVNEDPRFVDQANGNFSLRGGSPAVAKVPFTPGDVDFLGTLRPQPVTAALADMGAYEVNETSGVADWVIY